MSDEDVSSRLRAAYAELDHAVQGVMNVWRDERVDADSDDEDTRQAHPETLTDWVVVAGSQFFDDDGDRAGVVSILPRGGMQPTYITAGLLQQGLSKYQ